MSRPNVLLIAETVLDEPEGLDGALDVAHRLGADLTIAECAEKRLFGRGLIRQKATALDELASRARSRGLRVSTCVFPGRSARVIHRETEGRAFDLVLRPAARARFEWLAENRAKYRRAAALPVWTIRSVASESPHVLACLELDSTEDPCADASVLRVAQWSAAMLEARLSVVCARNGNPLEDSARERQLAERRVRLREIEAHAAIEWDGPAAPEIESLHYADTPADLEDLIGREAIDWMVSAAPERGSDALFLPAPSTGVSDLPCSAVTVSQRASKRIARRGDLAAVC